MGSFLWTFKPMAVNSDIREDLEHYVSACIPSPMAEIYEGRYETELLFIELRWEDDQYID